MRKGLIKAYVYKAKYSNKISMHKNFFITLMKQDVAG
jgi:hypothetical protein